MVQSGYMEQKAMTNEITNRQDTINTTDIEERIDELEASIAAATEDGERVDPDEQAELDALKNLKAQAEPYCADWYYGETLVNDSYFEDYARELAEDIGAVDKNAAWPNNHIDWEAASEALKRDYTSVEFDGVTFWLR